jgi:4-hydroxy-tetrahydrodipicolinate reductase
VIRVGVIGAAGRMGRETCRAVMADPALELVAAVDPSHAGQTIEGVVVAGSLDALTDAGAEVATEFTRGEVAPSNIDWCIAHGIHVVTGTTGFDPDPAWAAQRDVGVFVASNFAIGAVLMMRFAEQAARHLADAEIVELHHGDKPDAPSGTSIATARRIAAARRVNGPAGRDPAAERVPAVERISGARGADVDGVRVHSVRLPGLVAHQEVLFGGLGQTLSVRHDSTSHASFMPGVLLAVKAVSSRPGLTLGLDTLLDDA